MGSCKSCCQGRLPRNLLKEEKKNAIKRKTSGGMVKNYGGSEKTRGAKGGY